MFKIIKGDNTIEIINPCTKSGGVLIGIRDVNPYGAGYWNTIHLTKKEVGSFISELQASVNCSTSTEDTK